MDVLIWGDTETSAELRHEVPLSIGDPFLYLETDGRRIVLASALEEARLAAAAPQLERLLVDELGGPRARWHPGRGPAGRDRGRRRVADRAVPVRPFAVAVVVDNRGG